jgi:hypothetical protein
MKIFQANLANANNYEFNSKGLTSSSGVSPAVSALLAKSTGSVAISSVSIDTMDAGLLKSIKLVTISNKRTKHEMHIKVKKASRTRARDLTVNFVVVSGSSITSDLTDHQNKQYATYTMNIGETALTTPTQLELNFHGNHCATPGIITIQFTDGTSTQIDFSGNGNLEFEFPIQVATVSNDEVAVARQAALDTIANAGWGDWSSVIDWTSTATCAGSLCAQTGHAAISGQDEDGISCATSTITSATPSDAPALHDHFYKGCGVASGFPEYSDLVDYCNHLMSGG